MLPVAQVAGLPDLINQMYFLEISLSLPLDGGGSLGDPSRYALDLAGQCLTVMPYEKEALGVIARAKGDGLDVVPSPIDPHCNLPGQRGMALMWSLS